MAKKFIFGQNNFLVITFYPFFLLIPNFEFEKSVGVMACLQPKTILASNLRPGAFFNYRRLFVPDRPPILSEQPNCLY